ncbi:hypothetical protein FPOA_06938 [Fusarium poae]|uniref:Uncharacterized protein n=1 Tax=Fusarium poae TaxID=36050 RepID=A0A1B8AJR8_FUSPO|nr:hypothetical protein FPOA_06938 [Fusarium poae]
MAASIADKPVDSVNCPECGYNNITGSETSLIHECPETIYPNQYRGKGDKNLYESYEFALVMGNTQLLYHSQLKLGITSRCSTK